MPGIQSLIILSNSEADHKIKRKAGDASNMVSFSKYHGCGNSFVIVKEEELRQYTGDTDFESACSEFAVKSCAEHTGAGADGMIVVREKPHLEMIFFNCDGSRAPMCGNGIRCFANFCYDEDICKDRKYAVKTLAGKMIVEVTSVNPFRVRIDMGSPLFFPEAIGVNSPDEDFFGKDIEINRCDENIKIKVYSMFMGTVHTVVFSDDIEESFGEKLDEKLMEEAGEIICNHPVFAEKTNVNFVSIQDKNTIKMRTYERGVGMTLACGTGACACVVAANKRGLCENDVEVILPIGRLYIEIRDDGHVYMQGPSVKIFDGNFVEI